VERLYIACPTSNEDHLPVVIKIELRFDTPDEAHDFADRCLNRDNAQRSNDPDEQYAARLRRIEENGRPLLKFLERELEKKGLAPPKPYTSLGKP
jgi:adenylate kinase family enzyme